MSRGVARAVNAYFEKGRDACATVMLAEECDPRAVVMRIWHDVFAPSAHMPADGWHPGEYLVDAETRFGPRPIESPPSPDPDPEAR